VPESGLSEELTGELEELQGYSTAYAKLANAARLERPVLAEIPDPKQYLESSLARVMAGR
jgi:exportin-2 (importin alpha re-exporter)